MTFLYFSKNGELLPLSDAVMPLQNIAYQYGFGVYETLKVRKKVLYFVKQHVERLLHSARIIGLTHIYNAKTIIQYIQDVIEKNDSENCNIKMLLIGGKKPEEATLFILPLAPLFPDRKLYSHGATAETVQHERFLPHAKTLNMLASYLYYTQAQKKGHYDVIFVDKKGDILEGSRTNFFVIKDNVIITPPKKKILEGVTRQTVIAAAKKGGFAVQEKNIPLDTLKKFDGAFLTSTSTKIVPLIQIDSFRYSFISPKLKELMRLYDTFLEASKGKCNY